MSCACMSMCALLRLCTGQTTVVHSHPFTLTVHPSSHNTMDAVYTVTVIEHSNDEGVPHCQVVSTLGSIVTEITNRSSSRRTSFTRRARHVSSSVTDPFVDTVRLVALVPDDDPPPKVVDDTCNASPRTSSGAWVPSESYARRRPVCPCSASIDVSATCPSTKSTIHLSDCPTGARTTP